MHRMRTVLGDPSVFADQPDDILYLVDIYGYRQFMIDIPETALRNMVESGCTFIAHRKKEILWSHEEEIPTKNAIVRFDDKELFFIAVDTECPTLWHCSSKQSNTCEDADFYLVPRSRCLPFDAEKKPRTFLGWIYDKLR